MGFILCGNPPNGWSCFHEVVCISLGFYIVFTALEHFLTWKFCTREQCMFESHASRKHKCGILSFVRWLYSSCGSFCLSGWGVVSWVSQSSSLLGQLFSGLSPLAKSLVPVLQFGFTWPQFWHSYSYAFLFCFGDLDILLSDFSTKYLNYFFGGGSILSSIIFSRKGLAISALSPSWQKSLHYDPNLPKKEWIFAWFFFSFFFKFFIWFGNDFLDMIWGTQAIKEK